MKNAYQNYFEIDCIALTEELFNYKFDWALFGRILDFALESNLTVNEAKNNSSQLIHLAE